MDIKEARKTQPFTPTPPLPRSPAHHLRPFVLLPIMSDTDESSGFSSLLANMRAAMEKPDPPLILPLPESVLGKRNRGDYEQDDDESTSASPEGSTPGDSNEEGSTSSAIQPVPNKNIANLARQVGTAMYLRADQVEALVSFALVSPQLFLFHGIYLLIGFRRMTRR